MYATIGVSSTGALAEHCHNGTFLARVNGMVLRLVESFTRWLVVSVVACAAVAGTAHAEPIKVRTHLAPGTGFEMKVHPQVALSLQGQMRLPDVAGPMTASAGKPGALVRTGLSLRLTEIVAGEIGYAYAWGVFPVEGPARQEHRPELGLRVGTVGEGPFSLVNRLRLDLRILEESPGHWRVRPRPRDEVRLNFQFAPAFALALTVEGLVQAPWTERTWLQLRGGLVAHGRIGLGRRPDGDEPRAYLQWHVGDQLAFWPLAMGRIGKSVDAALQLFGQSPQEHVGAHIENVIGGGLSVLF